MTARVPNPGGGGTGILRYISATIFTTPGSGTIQVPAGATWMRLIVRGGGGGGGFTTATGPMTHGGGQGALQRRFVPVKTAQLNYTVGRGGDGDTVNASTSGAQDGGNSSLGSYTARGGKAGNTANAKGGAGADGPETVFGYGEYQGADALTTPYWQGGGNTSSQRYADGTMGAGGNGAIDAGGQGSNYGNGKGGDGYVSVEFFTL